MNENAVIELCAGYGGLFMGLQAVTGARLAAYSEIDPGANAIMAHHHPDVPNLGDVKAIDWSAVTPPRWLIGGYPCFTAETPVLTRDGYKAISEIRVGDLVLTHQRRWRPVTALMSKEAPSTVTVYAQGTQAVRCTPEHPWWTREGEWVGAKDLKGRRVVQVLPERESTQPGISSALLWALGRHLADGYVQDRPNRPDAGRVTVTCAHEEVSEVLSGLSAAGLHGYVSRGRTASKVAVTRNDFYRLARSCGRGAGEKHVPGWLLAGLTEEGARALLAGYLSGDGYRDEQRKAWTASTVSENLALSMALVAQRAHGVVCSVRLNAVPETKVIEGRTVRQRPFWKLVIPDRNRSGICDDGAAYKLCRRVEPSGPARVYNIAIKEDESYVVNNAVVHNCQPFSDAGQRLGAADPRHLWPWFVPAIAALQPDFVLFENVRGHVRRGLSEVCADLADLGYGGAWTVVRASDVGAPHQRARVFILASRHVRPGVEEIECSTPPGGRLLPTPRASDTGTPGRAPGVGFRPALSRVIFDLAADFPLFPTPQARDGKGQPSHAGFNVANLPRAVKALPADGFGEYAPAVARWEHVTGVPAPAALVADSRSGQRLNPAFSEWMMGTPAGHVTAVPGLGVHALNRAIGNGVVPLQASYAVSVLMRTLSQQPRKVNAS